MSNRCSQTGRRAALSKSNLRRSLPALLVLPLCALAQSAVPTEFPADASSASAQALHEQISGKVFRVKPADGSSWRLEYKPNGYAFVDTSSGFRDSGRWRVEDGKLCADWHRANSGCGEVRLKGDSIYLKRLSGEVVVLRAE
jgi:hypothetical protein